LPAPPKGRMAAAAGGRSHGHTEPPTLPAGGDACIREGQPGPADNRPVVTPAQFDGTTDLGEFMAHFQLCIRANGWTEEAAGMFLGLSLRGNARRLLTGIVSWKRGGYNKLVAALENRFQPKDQAESHKAMFRNRDRRPEEDLLTYAERLEQLARLGYPEADGVTLGSLAKDRFLDGLKDNQLKYFILYSQPRTLGDAVTVGVRAEAHILKDREGGRGHRVHATDATMAGELEALRSQFAKEIGPLRADLLRELANLRKELTAAGGPTGAKRTNVGKRECYLCGQEGHFKRECPLRVGQDNRVQNETLPTATQQPSGNDQRSLQ
jgi:hypothetical protein